MQCYMTSYWNGCMNMCRFEFAVEFPIRDTENNKYLLDSNMLAPISSVSFQPWLRFKMVAHGLLFDMRPAPGSAPQQNRNAILFRNEPARNLNAAPLAS